MRTLAGSTLALAIASLIGCGRSGTTDAGGGAPDAASAADAATPCPLEVPTGELGLDGGTARWLAPPGAHCDGTRALVVALATDESARAGWDELVSREGIVLVVLAPGTADTSPWREAGGLPSTADRARAEQAVHVLADARAIDPARVFVWADGAATALAVPWLASSAALAPAGLALTDLDPSIAPDLAPTTLARLFLSTGARAPGIDAQIALRAAADTAGLDTVVRARDDGAGSPAWLAAEAWAWLDRGLRVENGPRSTTWAPIRFPWDATLFALTPMPDGTLRAASLEGDVFGTNDSGKWDRLARLGEGALVDAIVGPGDALVIASTRGLAGPAGGGITREPGPGAVRALARDGSTLVAITETGLAERGASGVWSAIATPRADLDALAISPVTHTLLAAGAGARYVRRDAGGSIETRESGSDARRFDAVVAGDEGTFWMVGAGGIVLRSTDDGLTFTRLVAPADDPLVEDLYVAGAGPGGALVAGGAHGLVVTSHDGQTLRAARTGWLGPIGGVTWLNSGEIFVTSEHGVVLVAEGL